MEDMTAFLIVCFYALGIAAVIIILVFLVFRRIRIKKTEDFEKRDN